MRDADIGRRTSDAGHRTAKKAKIIYPPPRGVDIIKSLLAMKCCNVASMECRNTTILSNLVKSGKNSKK